MEKIIFISYRILYLLIYFLVRLLWPLLPKGKLKNSLSFRFAKNYIIKPSFDKNSKTICVHAASGEIEYAYPLIKKIKDSHPQLNILVTLSSTSVLSAIQHNHSIDAYGPAPLDTAYHCQKFLTQFSPTLLLFSRTDVWPELLNQLEKKRIPSFLFSCTLAENSSRKGFLSRYLTSFSLNKLQAIFTVSADDKSNLKQLGITTTIEIFGDTRYDQIELKKKNPLPLKNLFPLNQEQEEFTLNENHPVSNRKVFLAGSTWEPDENVLVPLISQLPNWKWIFAPHEVDKNHIDKITNLVQKNSPNSKLQFYSQFIESQEWDVLIVDQFGKLFHLYEYADACFIGGSFKDKVHSVMEPLAFNKYVFVGPYYKNNREAIEFSATKLNSGRTIVQVIKSRAELQQYLLEIEHQKTELKLKDYTQIAEIMGHKKNATERVYNYIKDLRFIN